MGCLGLLPAILANAATVLDEIQKGNISRFFVIGGCDGYEGARNYFTEVGANLPDTGVILTMGCGKFRVNHLERGALRLFLLVPLCLPLRRLPRKLKLYLPFIFQPSLLVQFFVFQKSQFSSQPIVIILVPMVLDGLHTYACACAHAHAYSQTQTRPKKATHL